MGWIKVSAEEYDHARVKNLGVFHSGAFNALNAHKVNAVDYWVYKDTKKRFGIVFGSDNQMVKSPFSSPFGGIEAFTTSVDIEILNRAIQELIPLYKGSVRLIIPPAFYGENLIHYAQNAFLNQGFKLIHYDLNYHFETSDLPHYIERIDRSARKNLNNSLKSNHDFVLCHTMEEKLQCYDIIKQNRQQRGFPLRLSFDAVLEMEKLTTVYFNYLTIENQAVAAAICYKVTDQVASVVYWGNLVESAHLRPMNLLAYKLFHQMNDLKYDIIDIGHSTDLGLPNFGLCKFKENIGCRTSPKVTLLKSTDE